MYGQSQSRVSLFSRKSFQQVRLMTAISAPGGRFQNQPAALSNSGFKSPFYPFNVFRIFSFYSIFRNSNSENERHFFSFPCKTQLHYAHHCVLQLHNARPEYENSKLSSNTGTMTCAISYGRWLKMSRVRTSAARRRGPIVPVFRTQRSLEKAFPSPVPVLQGNVIGKGE